VQVGEAGFARGVRAGGPGDRCRRELVVLEFRERAGVTRRVDDDLLAFERRIEIRDDADAPAWRIGAARTVGDGEALRRRAILPALAERAFVELRLRRRLDQARGRAGTPAAVRRDRDQAAGEWIPPQVGQLGGFSR
jgi:hypothetical protein